MGSPENEKQREAVHDEMYRRAVLAGIGWAITAPSIVGAQAEWPKGPIKFIVPFPPGGGTDPIARITQTKLIETTGWQIVVENKPGAAGVIGATAVAKAAPDGQTWLVTFDSHILSPAFGSNLAYKDSDLFNVMLFGRAPLVITCHPDRPYRNFSEAMADARKRPGKVSMGMLSNSQSLLLMNLLEEGQRLRHEPDLLQGRRADRAGRGSPGVTDLSITTLVSVTPRSPPASCGPSPRRREAFLRPARHTDPGRAGQQDLPDLFVVGDLCADGNAQARYRSHARRAHQGRAFARCDQEVRRSDSPRDRRQHAGGVRRLQQREQERWFKVIKDNDIRATSTALAAWRNRQSTDQDDHLRR